MLVCIDSHKTKKNLCAQIECPLRRPYGRKNMIKCPSSALSVPWCPTPYSRCPFYSTPPLQSNHQELIKDQIMFHTLQIKVFCLSFCNADSLCQHGRLIDINGWVNINL